MLVNKSGFRVFNEFDLSITLDAQLSRAKKEIDSEVQSLQINDEAEYVSRQVSKHRISPLELREQDLTVTTSEQMISSDYFPSGFLVYRGKSYPKEVLTFHLPFNGDETLLRCVPSTRILRTEEVAIGNSEIRFDIINFSNAPEAIKGKKNEIISFLVQQSGHVNKQVIQYNDNLEKAVKEAVNSTKGKMSQRSELLNRLGVPLKTDSSIKYGKDTVAASNVTDKKVKEYDVFICHASEDKIFVRSLADALKKSGMEVWYDDFQLGWGEDLRPAIDNGLKNSRYGIVIFSKSFLAKKKWTEYELNGLFAREKQGQYVILPVWHDIKREDLAVYSPTLADRLAKKSDSVDEIVTDLKKLLSK